MIGHCTTNPLLPAKHKILYSNPDVIDIHDSARYNQISLRNFGPELRYSSTQCNARSYWLLLIPRYSLRFVKLDNVFVAHN
jgi:hypothetical protein